MSVSRHLIFRHFAISGYISFAVVMVAVAASGCAAPARVAAAPVPLSIRAGAAERFAGALRFATTFDQQARPNRPAFVGLHAYLRQSFPRTFAALEVETVAGLSLLMRWRGTDATASPLVISAHLDVVPVENPQRWAHAPFGGVIQDGIIHGRGTLDDKFSVLSVLEAAESLLEQGQAPNQDVYFAFGHDEEIMGTRGALAMAERLRSRSIHAAFLLDEGPPVARGLLPMRPDLRVAYVGIAAKGQMYLTLRVRGPGGHASTPPKENPALRLAGALMRLQDGPLAVQLTQPVKSSFKALAPAVGMPAGLLFAHPGLFSPFLINALDDDPISRSVVHSSVAVTILRAGDKDATIPAQATATIAVSLLPGEDLDTKMDQVRRRMDDDAIETDVVTFPDNGLAHAYAPTPVSSLGHSYNTVRQHLFETFGDVVVAPTLMPGGSDAKHYQAAGVVRDVYYVNPLQVSKADLERMHGDNEQIPVSAYLDAVRFYTFVLRPHRASGN